MLESFTALFTPYAVQVGLSCLAMQCGFYVLFATNFFGLLGKQSRQSTPWSQTPGFSAHQAVCIPVLGYLTIMGFLEWVFDREDAPTAVDRILGPLHGHVSEFVLGMMFFWDIPTGLLTPSLRELAMMLHHFGMIATAAVSMGAASDGQPLLGYYAPFFFGLIELSSLPLIIVDLFHPKHKEWHRYLTSDDAPKCLQRINEISRLLFAVCFLVLRTCLFPYVTFLCVLPDVTQVLSLPLEDRYGVQAPPLIIMAGLDVLFSILQLYWGSLLMRQIIKMIRGPATKKKKE